MTGDMELLAPAGGEAALRAAVQSGADAVYMGGPKFGARHSAENFSVGDIKKWTEYCHLYDVDVHVAVNTLVKEKELGSLVEYAYELNDAGVDALIVQDMGAARLIHKALPDMALHGSTQMTVTSLDGVKYLEELGFSRVVLARELSAKEIEYIVRGAKAEIEVFVHGAICMCYSGQCLMSSILGGRSGNRGRCAQPCRLPYSLTEHGRTAEQGYLLSPKDMALVNDLKTLREIGVSSLKIEGRLKRAEYVSAVVGIYRKYLDNTRPISDKDMNELKAAFSRSGFTNGYFRENLGRGMMSHKNPGNGENSFTADAKARTLENANVRKIPIDIVGTLKKNAPVEITIYDENGNCVTQSGTQNSERAKNKPMDKERFLAQVLKLGTTPFVAENTVIDIDDGITIPIKEINNVRRAATDMLIQERKKRPDKKAVRINIENSIKREMPENIEIVVQVSGIEQAKAAIKEGIKCIYAPAKLAKEIKKLSDKVNVIARACDIFREENIEGDSVMVSSPAAIHFYKNKKLYGDFRLNAFNSETVKSFSELERITVSPELNLNEIRSIAQNTKAQLEVIAYGRIPLMIMRNCPIKAAGHCQKNKNIYSLRDRKNEEFPLICTDNCNAVLLNSKPIYMADKLSDLTELKINALRLIFTVENYAQCGKIIKEYRNALGGKPADKPEDNSFTRGHYYRGVK